MDEEKILKSLLENKKYCKLGNHYISKDHFNKNKNTPDGLLSTCKDCLIKRNATSYKAGKNRVLLNELPFIENEN